MSLAKQRVPTGLTSTCHMMQAACPLHVTIVIPCKPMRIGMLEAMLHASNASRPLLLVASLVTPAAGEKRAHEDY